MRTNPSSAGHMAGWCASAALACLALAGCEREPTPKMSSADMALPGTATAQSDTGTAMGMGSLAGAPQASGAGSSFDALTRDNPTAAGMPPEQSVQDRSPGAPVTAATLSSAEQKFIAQAGAKSLFEVKVSELAADKARDPALKSYAALVAADHKGVGDELKRLAAGHGVSLSDTLLPQDEKTLAALRNVSGQAFDKQYLQTVGVNEHEKTIANFEKAGEEATNPAVKDYVQSTLPTLKSHLDAARKLQTKG